MKTRLFLLSVVLGLAATVFLGAQEPQKPGGADKTAAPAKAAPSQAELEEKFISALTRATLSGRWCVIKDGQLTPEKDEKYTIVGVTRLAGDNWLINARLKYGEREIIAPIPAQVKWAGDTAVICVTDLTIPRGGTYTARVLIFGNTYAGTWSGQDHGGLLNGIITTTPK